MLKKYIIPSLVVFTFTLSSIAVSCKKEDTPTTPVNYSWTEEFDTLQNSIDRGWVIQNNSRPGGAESWIQGIYGVTVGKTATTISGYGAFSSMYSGQDYAIATYAAVNGSGTISAWLFSPATTMKNGDVIEFYTRTLKNPADFSDRLQVRLNPLDTETTFGDGALTNSATAENVGNYKTLLLDINPTLLKTGAGSYPGTWTKYTATISGLAAPLKRRFAFRYYVTDGGSNGVNSEGVGLDQVKFISK